MKRTLSTILIVLFLGISNLFAQISMKKENGGFQILDGGKKVAFYQKAAISMNTANGRNNFLHPVYLPDGTVITENAPEDHPHHRGIFWAWHQILINGKSICDAWELKGFNVEVKSIEFKRIADGDGVFQTYSFWKSPAYEGGRKAFLKEDVQYTFYKQTANYRVIKFDIELKAMVDSLTLGGSDDEKGYGGFSVRMKLPEDVLFTGANGTVEPQNTAVDAGQYIDISGAIAKNGNPGGVLIYANPANQPGPQTWILRKKDSMQNAVFPGRTPIELKRGIPLKLSYTAVLYTGKINEKRIVKELSKAE